MVYAERDVLDKQFNFDEMYSYMTDKKVVLYTGRILYCVSLCFNKLQKKYSVTLANGDEMNFKASAIVLMEDC